MFSTLPLNRSRGALLVFLGGAVTTAAIVLWANRLSPTDSAANLAPIFFYLFTVGDYQGGTCALLVLLAAALLPVSYSRPLLRWVGAHPVRVAALCGVALAGAAGAVYLNSRLSMDEYAAYFQSQVFAGGHLAGRFPVALLDWLIPPGFQDYFLNVSQATGRVASAYWPSFALLLAPFTWLGVPWLCNPLMSALTLLAVHRLAWRIFGDHETAGLAVLLTVASPVFFADGISYYSMSAHLLANTVYALLLFTPTLTPPRAFLAGVLGSVALTLHNPVPHFLFALPWILYVMTRPDGLRRAVWLFAGYAPLSLLLGYGWFLYSNSLTHEGLALAPGTGSLAEHLSHMLRSAFAPPSSTIVLARVIGLAKIWVWAVPALPLLAAVGAWTWRRHAACSLLLASALVTLVFYLFVPVDQGHGWGFRYFHSAWIALPILAAAALTPATATDESGSRILLDGGTRDFVVACAVFSLLLGTAFRGVQMHAFIRDHDHQLPLYGGTERRVVIVDTAFSFYGQDLVQNDPWLRGSTIRMITHGAAADMRMMRENFPDMHRVAADRFGTVWSAQSPPPGPAP